MTNETKGKNVHIGPDGTIYIGGQPEEAEKKKKKKKKKKKASSSGTGTSTTSTTPPPSTASTTSTVSTSSTSSTASASASALSGDSKYVRAAVCAIVGAISVYFIAADPSWIAAVIGAVAGALCVMLYSISVIFWGIILLGVGIYAIFDPTYAFFQEVVPPMAMIVLMLCMSLIEWAQDDGTWDGFVEGVICIVALISFVVSVGILHLNFETPVVGPVYAQILAAQKTDEDGARAFAEQYFSNAWVDSDGEKSPHNLDDWADRVRACMEPDSPAMKKFDSWLDSTPIKGLGFMSVVERVQVTSTNYKSVTVIVTYRGTQNPTPEFGKSGGTTNTTTFVCTMTDSHFVRDYL